MTTFKYPIPTLPFIHGKYVQPIGKERLTLRSSLDDSIVTEELHCASAADVDAAVESAAEGLKAWSKFTTKQRSVLMMKYADLITKNVEHIGYLDTIVTGKPYAAAVSWEANATAESFRYFAGFTDKFHGDMVDSNDGLMKIIRHEPLGITAAINPFNGPIICYSMKAAPALAMGNVMICKASELNPLGSLYLAELAIEAGIPPGVINMLVGTIEAGQALSMHMKIRMISFTGSIATGRRIQVAAAQSNLKRVALELGGKSAAIIFPDVDIDETIATATTFMWLSGQGCMLTTRNYVHESIAEEYISKMKAFVEANSATLGSDPYNPRTITGPLFHHRQKEVVLKFIEKAKTEAELLTGGETYGTAGCFIQPTVFIKPKDGAQIVEEEVFGPVLVIDTFKTEEEALRKANNTEYGLGAAVHTRDLDRAIRVANALEAGSVAVNTRSSFALEIPFGGFKASGIGRENSKYVLEEYTQLKSISIKVNPNPKPNE